MILFLAGAASAILVLLVLIRIARLTIIIRSQRHPKKTVYSGTKQKRRKMLHPLQQDILSALVHQGASYREAERIVLELPANLSFDEMFRRAVTVLRTEKKAAAA